MLDRRLVGAEIAGDVDEESEAVLLRQARVAVEDDPRQRDARGLAAPRDQLARELDEVGDARPRMLVAARQADQPAAALRDRREEIAEERDVHRFEGRHFPDTAGPIRWSGSHVAMPGKIHKITIASIMHST